MLFSIVKSLALGVWLGALVMLAFAVAAPLFQTLPSRTMAGNLNQVILSRMNTIEWICWALAMTCSIVLLVVQWKVGPRSLRIAETVMLVLMAGFLWYYSSSITSHMTGLRATIKDFDTPSDTREYIEARREFDDAHKLYTKMVGFNMLLIVASFAVSVSTAAPMKSD